MLRLLEEKTFNDISSLRKQVEGIMHTFIDK